MSAARVQFFSVSLDGFGTGEGLTRDAPFGHAGDRLHEWMFATRFGRTMLGREAGKFGYPGWHEDPEWKGWWGADPPFHTPVFVLTHHVRPSIEMEGGTMFNFLDASPSDALERAREAAGGQDVRIGGGVAVVRDFLGRGVRLWDGLERLEADYDIEAVSTPSGVTHMTFTRSG